MEYLNKPASIGDVIKWIILVPAFTAIFVIMPFIFLSLIPKYETMYYSVYGSGQLGQPYLASIFIPHFRGIYYTVSVITVIGLLYAVMSKRSHLISVGVAAVCNCILWSSIAGGFLAVWIFKLHVNQLAA